MITLKHILVPTDFSESSDAALRYGRDLARGYGATLHVLHVTDDLTVRYNNDLFLMLPANLQEDVNRAARTRLEGLLSAEDREQLRAKTVLRTSAATAHAIVEYAHEEPIDLIVVGTHGRGAMSRLFVGSVADRVVRTAPCPVLAVRHPERDFIAPDALQTVAKA